MEAKVAFADMLAEHAEIAEDAINSKRMHSKDVNALIKPLSPYLDYIPVNFPPVILNTFKEIEQLIRDYHNAAPGVLVIDHVAKLGLPQEVINELTAKMYELEDMIRHADDNTYMNHLSMGSLTNVGMTVLRRCFYVVVNRKTPQIPADNKYPFVEVKHPALLNYLSSLYLRIYKFGLSQQLFPLYVSGCLQLCCYNPRFVKFNVQCPMKNIRWQQIFDFMFEFVRSSKIPCPDDTRKSTSSR